MLQRTLRIGIFDEKMAYCIDLTASTVRWLQGMVPTSLRRRSIEDDRETMGC